MDTSVTLPVDSARNPAPVLAALKKSRGRVTVGDVVSDTGMPRDQVESVLRDLLESRRGHMEVGETGALVYRFDPKLLKRDAEPLLSRLAGRSRAVFREAFKIWIVLMLVVYFVLFVALLVAAVVASQSRGGGRGRSRDFGLGRRRGGGMPGFWVWYFFWRPGWGWRRPYYGHRWEKRYGRGGDRGKEKVPFIKKVFAFVFGPDAPRPTQRQKDRSVIRLIRARRGVLTATELVQHTGIALHEAEEEMGRLMGAYDGDVRVTPKGGLVYVFPELMLSAGGRVSEREPDPAWRRLEPAESWTGNEAKSNAAIAGINGFNLTAAATAPWFIFPQLGLGGPLAWIGLVWIPAIFSLLFFTIPLFRLFGVRRRNRKRQERNLRKILLAHVFQASLASKGARWITDAGTVERARALLLPGAGDGNRLRPVPKESNLPPERAWRPGFQAQLQRLTAEFDGEVEEMADGTVRYHFPEIRRAFQGAEVIRAQMELEKQEVGEIVYASDDSREDADQREVEAWEREMARQEKMDQYLPDPDRVAYLDEFELVAFDEEMKRGAIRA
ncbi:MAG: hypothetical protein R6T96_02275 [Longimicrobiales bacterium]